MLCFVILTARQTFAIERSWRGGNGPSGGNWSNPQNWFPNGVPQNGDDLEFLSGQATTFLNNDMPGLVVTSLTFGNDD